MPRTMKRLATFAEAMRRSRAHRAQQEEHGRSPLPHQEFVEVREARFHAPVQLRVLPLEVRGHGLQLLSSLLMAPTVGQPSHRPDDVRLAEPDAVSTPGRVQVGNPHLRRRDAVPESSSHDADDGAGKAIDVDRPPEDVRVSAEVVLPGLV